LGYCDGIGTVKHKDPDFWTYAWIFELMPSWIFGLI